MVLFAVKVTGCDVKVGMGGKGTDYNMTLTDHWSHSHMWVTRSKVLQTVEQYCKKLFKYRHRKNY